MINKDRNFFQYNSRDLVYLISLQASHLCTVPRKVAIKHISSLVIYEIIAPHNYLLMMQDGKILRGLFKCERLKPAKIRTNQGNVCNLSAMETDNKYRNEDIIKIS